MPNLNVNDVSAAEEGVKHLNPRQGITSDRLDADPA